MSKSGSEVAQGGVAVLAEHPGAARSPAWENTDAGEGGSLARHQVTQWVPCKGCSVCRDVERAVFPGAPGGVIKAEL